MSRTESSYRLNGQTRPLSAPLTLRELCLELGLGNRGGYAVECNGSIVPRSQLATTQVAPGDTIEIVHMVGGG